MNAKCRNNKRCLDNGMTAEFFSGHLPKRISSKLPELFSCVRDEIFFGGNRSNVVAFYDNGELIGACNLSFENFSVVNGLPAWEIYIERFEVVRKYRRMGYGTRMLKSVMDLFNVYNVSLSHFSRGVDGGISESFWKSLGFRHPKGMDVQYMEVNYR